MAGGYYIITHPIICTRNYFTPDDHCQYLFHILYWASRRQSHGWHSTLPTLCLLLLSSAATLWPASTSPKHLLAVIFVTWLSKVNWLEEWRGIQGVMLAGELNSLMETSKGLFHGISICDLSVGKLF
jgi:hypothetical protein